MRENDRSVSVDRHHKQKLEIDDSLCNIFKIHYLFSLAIINTNPLFLGSGGWVGGMYPDHRRTGPVLVGEGGGGGGAEVPCLNIFSIACPKI